ncbi:hypothetical protein WAI76_19865, partial [Acinetobacter baumannii]
RAPADPGQKTGWFVVDSLSVSERKGGKIRGYPIPKQGTRRSCMVIFFIYFAYTATIASRHWA